MSINLYFDVVTNNVHGQTTNGDKILYNLKQIGEKYFQHFTDKLSDGNKATIFAPTGRFLSIITASFDDKAAFMVTLDLMDNENFAKQQAALSEGNEELFMAAFYKIRQDLNALTAPQFILVEGQIPAPPNPEI